MTKLLLFLTAFFPIILLGQTTYFVKPDATGNNTGLSWSNAFTQLPQALQAAKPGDKIWLAAGNYRPSSTGDRSAFFDVKSGIALYGGFAGTETALSQRNWSSHPSVLEGDLGTPNDSSDNSWNLMRLLNPASTTLLDGLVFQHAFSNKAGAPFGELGGNGAALLIDGSIQAFPLIQHCTFLKNTAVGAGGAVFIKSGPNGLVAPRFIDCYFEANRADSGGAVYRQGSANTDVPDDFRDCKFVRNIANGSGSGITYADANGRTDTLDVIHCVFEANEARSPITLPAGAFFTNGRSNGACLRFVGSEFRHNTSKSGSGIVFYSEEFPLKYLLIDSCRFDSNYSFQWNASVSGLSVSVFSGYYDNGILKTRYEVRQSSFEHHKGPIMELAMLSKNNLYFTENTFQQNYNYYPAFGGGFDILSDTIWMEGNRFKDNPNILFTITANDYGKVLRNLVRRSSFNFACNKNPVLYINNIYDGGNELNAFNPSTKDVYHGNLILNNRFSIQEDPFLPSRKKWTFINNIFVNNRNLLQTEKAKYYQFLPFFHDSAYFQYNLFDFAACDSLGGKAICGVGNLFGADPMLTDTAAGDYQLKPCSPAFDAGSNTPYQNYGILQDFLGRTRISDARADMGPIEGQPLSLLAAPLIKAACTDTSGSVVFPMKNGCPPFQYQWSTGAKTGQGITGLSAGDYQFTITDQKGRQIYAIATVGPPHPPTVSAQITAANCPTCTTGKIALQVSGTSAYRYLWSTGATSISLSQVAPGTYTVTITDSGSCTYTFSYTVTFTSGVENITENGGLQLMPNPVQDQLRLQWTVEQVQEIAVLDALGRIILRQKTTPGTQQTTLEMGSLPAAWYLVRLMGSNGVLASARVAVL